MKKVHLIKTQQLLLLILSSLLFMNKVFSQEAGGCAGQEVLNVNFDNYPGLPKPYQYSSALKDFGQIVANTGPTKGLVGAPRGPFPQKNTVGNGVLKANYPAGANNGAYKNGFIWNTSFASAEEATIQYRVKFDPGFEWKAGGKLPGLGGKDPNFGGSIPVGCTTNQGSINNGFSARLMWRQNGKLVVYGYFPGRQKRCGDDITIGTIESGKWYTITQYIKLNTPGKRDGIIKVSIDGSVKLNKTDALIRNSAAVKINHALFHTYRGGGAGNAAFHASKTQNAYFDDFKVTANCPLPGVDVATEEVPTPPDSSGNYELGAPQGTANCVGVVSENGRLRVQGNKVVNQNGASISLAGNSLFWSSDGEATDYYNAETVAHLAGNWSSDIVRVAMGVKESFDGGRGYIDSPDAQKAKIRKVIDAAIANDIYVIIDWHSHDAELYTAQAAAFFKEMASLYGNNDHVIYEIYNEPIYQSWATIKAYAQTVIKAIRSVDPDNLIIVGTSKWSQDVDIAANSPIADPNTAYTLHFYAGTHKQELRDKANVAMSKGIALFVTEWGTVNNDGDGAPDIAESQRWVDFMRQNDISHANWSITDKAEGASVVAPGAGVNGLINDNLTETGKFVKDLILNNGTLGGCITVAQAVSQAEDQKNGLENGEFGDQQPVPFQPDASQQYTPEAADPTPEQIDIDLTDEFDNLPTGAHSGSDLGGFPLPGNVLSPPLVASSKNGNFDYETTPNQSSFDHKETQTIPTNIVPIPKIPRNTITKVETIKKSTDAITNFAANVPSTGIPYYDAIGHGIRIYSNEALKNYKKSTRNTLYSFAAIAPTTEIQLQGREPLNIQPVNMDVEIKTTEDNCKLYFLPNKRTRCNYKIMYLKNALTTVNDMVQAYNSSARDMNKGIAQQVREKFITLTGRIHRELEKINETANRDNALKKVLKIRN